VINALNISMQKRFTLPLVGLLSIFLAAEVAVAQENWPQWRGPLATGVAPDADPPLEWSETRNVKWKTAIPGFGTSTPVVWGDQVFILTAIPSARQITETPAPQAIESQQAERTGPGRRGGPGGPGGRGGQPTPTESYQFVVMAVDRETGAVRWQQTAREAVPHEGHHRDHGYASFSPVTDGENLYVHFGSRGLHAYDLAGNRKWEKDLGRMRTRMGFGEGGSLALHGDVLVVNWDHEGDDFIVGIDKRTGRELWRSERDEPSSWSTPLVVIHENRPQVVVSGTSRIRSYDLETGRQIWECGGMTENVIPTPVAGDGMVYVTSGFRGNALLAIELGHTGDLTGSDAVAWHHNRHTPYVPSPLLYGDRLYLFSGNTGMLSSFDARNGAIKIDAERIPGLPGVYASPVGAADRIYLVGREGQTVVIRHTDTVEVLASNTLDDRFDASAAVSGNKLFLRGHRSLYCLAE
jgi:outer membrane protein assembly factor BamB